MPDKKLKPTAADLARQNEALSRKVVQMMDKIGELEVSVADVGDKAERRVRDLQELIMKETLRAERAAGYIDRVLEDDALRDGTTNETVTTLPNSRSGPLGNPLPNNYGTITGRSSGSKPWWGS